jgi:hypothetical protein
LKAEEDRRIREQEDLLRAQKETEEELRRREWEAEVHRVQEEWEMRAREQE